MMQQVASVKADVAAFAALQDSSDQQDVNVAFEQILKQQQNSVPVLKPESSKAGGLKGEAAHTASTSSMIVDKNATASQPKIDSVTRANLSHEPQAKLAKAHSDKTELDEGSEDQSLEKSAEHWIDLVWSLQDQSLTDQHSDSVEIDSLQALQIWLEPIEDKLKALTDLMEHQPEIKSWLAGADVSQNELLHSLISQALSSLQEADEQAETIISKQNLELGVVVDGGQKPLAADPILGTSDIIRQELLQVSEDINELLSNNRLNSAEIQLVTQALSQSLNQNKPVTQDITDLLQEKLTSSPLFDATLVENGKAKQNDMRIIDEPQRNDSGKIALPLLSDGVLSDGEDLQALLDKITGLNKTATEFKTDIKARGDQQAKADNDLLVSQLVEQDKSQTQVNKATTVAIIEQSTIGASPLVNDKVSLSKEAVIVNNHVANKAESVAAVSLISNDELTALVNLSDKDLDLALNSVAQRIALLLRDEAKSQVGESRKTNSDVSITASTTGKDILAALKVGVAEFKQQLAAGHEPGLDLKALVAQALEKTGDGGVVAKVADGLDKSMRALSQSLAALNQINESSFNLAMNTAAIDSQVTQAEQHKTMQLNQFDNKLDKAVNLHKPEGHQQLADKVRWMVNTNNLMAEIRLDPAELGSVHVKVSLSAESATVNFVVQSQQTRDALEAATPKLREMLAEKGIELGQSTVKQDNQSKQDSQGGQQAKNGAALGADESLSEDETRLVSHNNVTNRSSGVIDYFV